MKLSILDDSGVDVLVAEAEEIDLSSPHRLEAEFARLLDEGYAAYEVDGMEHVQILEFKRSARHILMVPPGSDL